MRTIKNTPIPLLALVFLAAAGCATKGVRDATYNPQIDPANFTAGVVDNAFFPLVPGTVFTFIEKSKGETSENIVEVTKETKMIMGVKCVVVHDVVKENGRVTEDTYDWFAQDKQGAVWYFGEDTKEFSSRGKINTAGSWVAGINGHPGIIMPAHPTPGEPYRQEYSPNNAEDMGQVVAVDEIVTVPYGTFTGCVKTREWSPLEGGSENKWYARDIGCIRAKGSGGGTEELVSVEHE